MADSTINSSSSATYNPSASMSVANLTASAMMGAIMAGGDYGFVKDVQEKIQSVTQETRNAQSALRSAQQKSASLQAQLTASNSKKTAEESERKDKPSSKASAPKATADLQAQLAAAQQAVSDARQVVKNLQSQLTDLISRALPQAQQKEDTARQQDNQRAESQRNQGQASQAEQKLGKELTRTLTEGLEAGKGQAGAKEAKADQLPQSGIVDRTEEFDDVGEGEKNYNDAFLAGTAEQSPEAYAKTKKNAAAAKADDGMEGAPQSGGKAAPRSGAAPAGSGLPDAEGLSKADVAKLLGTPSDSKVQLAKNNTSPSMVSSAKAGTQMTSGGQATSVAPRPTGGGSTSGPQSGSSTAHASASSTRSSKVAEPADSGLSLAEAPTFGSKPAVSERGGQSGNKMGGNKDKPNDADAHATTTLSLGGVSVAVPRSVARAASSPAVSAAGQALVGSTRDDPEPMKAFLRSSQPDGRGSEQLASDTLGGFRQMAQDLGLGGGNAASAGARGSQAASPGGAAQNKLGGVMGLAGGGAGSFVAANNTGSSALDGSGEMDAATTATLAASVAGTQQGGQGAAQSPGAARGQSARGAGPGAPQSPAGANAGQTSGSAAAGAAQVARVASGTMGVSLGTSGKMRASLSESGSARAVVLGKVTRRAQDDIDPFDLSDVDTGGMDPDEFAQLSPLQRVMALMVSAAGEAEGQAKESASALTQNAELTQQLSNKKTELAVAIRAAGGLPDEGEPMGEPSEGTGESSAIAAPSQLLATPVSADLDANQAAHREVTRALDGAVTQGSGLLEQLQTATQLVTTFAQGANNVVHSVSIPRALQGKVGV